MILLQNHRHRARRGRAATHADGWRKRAEETPQEKKMRRTDDDFRRQLAGYSLATAEIFYRMPDARHILQTFIWQHYDLAPRFPELRKFLDFWTRELDGPIHSVRLAHATLIRPAEVRYAGHELTIH
jgi:uncharacterized protein Usg